MNLVKLEENIFEISSFLSVEECDLLIKLSESMGFKEADVQAKAGRQLLTNIRSNERVDYQSNEHAELFWKRLSTFKLPSFEGKGPIGLSPYLGFINTYQVKNSICIKMVVKVSAAMKRFLPS